MICRIKQSKKHCRLRLTVSGNISGDEFGSQRMRFQMQVSRDIQTTYVQEKSKNHYRQALVSLLLVDSSSHIINIFPAFLESLQKTCSQIFRRARETNPLAKKNVIMRRFHLCAKIRNVLIVHSAKGKKGKDETI